MRTRRKRPFKEGDKVLYKGFEATYRAYILQGNLHTITMDKAYVRANCRPIGWQSNIYAERQGMLYFRVKLSSLEPIYETNAQAKRLLEVDY